MIRDQIIPESEDDDPLLPHNPFGVLGSILEELIKRISHDGPIYKSDNDTVYSMFEEATRNSIYTSVHNKIIFQRKGWQIPLDSYGILICWDR